MQKIQSAPDRRWAKDVAPGDEIRALYLIGSASQLQAKNGPFWRIELKDASGDLEARIWSPLSQQFAEIPSGVIAEVEGRAESFRDKLQVNVNALRVLSPEETASVDTSAFMASSSRPPQEMLDELEALCRKEFTYKPWRKFILSVLEDEAIRVPLLTAPAAKSVHHAFLGGLLKHTANMVKIADFLAGMYPETIDRSLLLTGTLLHDFAKEREFVFSDLGIVTEYSTAGQLLGHLVMGAQEVADIARELAIAEEKSLLLQHLLLSHHGEPDFGAAVRPMCAEAELLSYIDLIDSRMEIYAETLPGVPAGGFSGRIFALEKKIYHHN